ncbi:probable S-adenosylmethionine-dependent methyltransferase At5g38780 [Papaver somniferum]|uniref:probable S-adenosylmethionine-dependent methyltransferase At5g38780 n=1 Tax=Papaver somniferum TaxID=3469 RepID=UPI000E7060A0|nr:probable S-adenosylmethionine-dependent methyltransferase At5g38780 [Papaver somniferum]
MRAASEEIFKQNFGFSDDDLDKLLDLYSERLVDPLSIFTKLEDKSFQMFLVLKCNSRRGIDLSQGMIKEAIAKEFNSENQLINNPNATFRIIDLDCSVGSNSLISVNSIIEAMDFKFESYFQGLELKQTATPEFQVYFNDISSNDFNTLFASIPLEKRYFAAGVPGSFYGRLFPRASLHFVNPSTALHWISRVPKRSEGDINSAWNKGMIHYSSASDEVFRAYTAQYVMDMEDFLLSRGHEIDIVDEAKVDSFNMPSYLTSPKQVKELVERTRFFTIERLEILETLFPPASGAQILTNHMRAASEEIFKQHFGFSDDDLDKLFDLYSERLVDPLSIFSNSEDKSFQMFLGLKRNNVSIAL